jgi:putative ABC transport system substrate-binding protein
LAFGVTEAASVGERVAVFAESVGGTKMRFLDERSKSSVTSIMRATAREVASLAIALALATCCFSVASAGETRRIGYLSVDSAELGAPFAAAFRNGLRESGFIEGQNIAIEWRFAGLNPDLLPALASELLGLRVELLVADGTQAALAAKSATRTIPIVVSVSADLVRAGLVTSLARPGGNLTGMSLMSPGLVGKRLALLKEMAPRIDRVAVVANPDNPASDTQLREAQEAAPGLGLKVHTVPIRRQADIDRITPSLAGRANAMLITGDFLLDANRAQIGSLALRNGMPWICNFALPEDKICLMWYGPDIQDIYVRAGRLAARVLNGTKPGDLPVEEPTKFVLGINASTASTLGITVPQSLLLMADEIVR